MASNSTFGNSVVYRNKAYPSASAALEDYISNYEASRQRVPSKFSHDVDELFLSTTCSSAKSSSRQGTGATQRNKAVADSSLLLSKLALEDVSRLPSPSSSAYHLRSDPSSSTVQTDVLLSKDPQRPSAFLDRIPSGTSIDTEALLHANANQRNPSKVPSIPSATTVSTDSLVNLHPTSALLGDTDSVATDFLLDVAARGAQQAANELKPKGEEKQYLSHQQLEAIKKKIAEQLKLADSLRQSIRVLEESRASKSAHGTMNRANQKAAEAEDILLNSRLEESRRKLYEYIGVEASRNSSLPESVASSAYTGVINAPSWVEALEAETASEGSSIITGNLLDQLRNRHRKLHQSDQYKMASTPNRGHAQSVRPKFDFSGTKSTIYMNSTRDQQSRYSPQVRTTRSANVTGAMQRSKSAAGRLIGNRHSSCNNPYTGKQPSYESGHHIDPRRSNSSGSVTKNSRITFSDTMTAGDNSPTGQDLRVHEIANAKHREFLSNLQKDIEDSKSSIAASLATDNLLMDSIPHVKRQSKSLPQDTDSPKTDSDDQSGGSDNISPGVVNKSIFQTPPPKSGKFVRTKGIEESPDTEAILSGDRSWERVPNFKASINIRETTDNGKQAYPNDSLQGPNNEQPGSLETLKHMLFSLQSMTEPAEGDSGGSHSNQQDEDSVGFSAPAANAAAVNYSLPLDDSTAELLRKTNALTSDMETKLVPLLHTMGNNT